MPSESLRTLAPSPTHGTTRAVTSACPPAPLQFPDCDGANPLAAQEGSEFFASINVDIPESTGPTDLETFTRLTGPVAQHAMERAQGLTGCTWSLYIAGHSVTQYTSQLAASDRDALVAGLRDSDYIESPLAAATVFTHVVDDPTNYRMNGATTIQHLLVSDAWIAIFETGESDYALAALEALCALNPQLTC